ncbi:PWWP domain-containing protein2 [Sphaceloma murrayae]|uniref:PWWP domain-containing protein2 n=1 Tax=Sphaceloma murrayae TaxID=2082308 RepID=A0A2K1R3E0_9PEZI|nr:PWWP domain-containing protein2 [Sphaceloma murrayae]
MPRKVDTTNAPASPPNGLSAREQELMSMAWQCMETEPKLDMKKFAEMAKFTNPRSATNAWRTIKTKLGINATPSKKGAADTTGPSSDASSRKRTKKQVDDGDEDESPTKKPRASKGTKVKLEIQEDDDEEDQDALGSMDEETAGGALA